jgi:amino acid transporter
MSELKRVAGYGTIIALTIGSIMGTGMFMGPAIGAAKAGNASILSWLILSVLSLYIGACFGELIAMFPRAGGVYEFGKQTYGRFASFIIGWLAWLVGNITTVVLIVAGVEYLLPGPRFIIIKIALSCVFLFVLNLVAMLGMRESSTMVITFTIISFIAILGVLIPGLFFFRPENILPIYTGEITPIFITIFFIAESFFGWEAASYLAEETKNPEKIIPRSLLISSFLVATLAVLLAVCMLGVLGKDVLAQYTAPLIQFSQKVFELWGLGQVGVLLDAVRIGAYLTLLGCAAGNIITMPRLLLALARDKLFLAQFAEIHPKFATPHRAIIFQFFVCIIILLIGFGRYKMLLSLLVPLGLVMYSTVMVAVSVWRFKAPNLDRKFKAPLGKFVPWLIVIFFISLVYLWARNEPESLTILGLGGSLIFIGVPLYWLIELYNDPNMITEVNDLLAYLSLVTESINIPIYIRKEILTLVGNIEAKDVLEFGCGVGTLTIHLSKAIGPQGTIYATSFSKNHLKITQKRLLTEQYKTQSPQQARVLFLHDLEHTTRVHPDVGRIDAAISVGTIGYLQDVEKVLQEINELMVEGGKICFMDYGDFFHVMPNVAWLSDNKKIEQIFRDNGFSVWVKRKKGLLWNYIFIYGIKFRRDVPMV